MRYNLSQYSILGQLEAKSESEVFEVMAAFSKLAREIPPEKLVKMAKKINDPSKGSGIIKKMQLYI